MCVLLLYVGIPCAFGMVVHEVYEVTRMDEDKMPSRETMEVTASGLQKESQQHDWEDTSMDLEESVYGFESPRPVTIFGPSSWNSLCLAVNKNLVTQSEVYAPCHAI